MTDENTHSMDRRSFLGTAGMLAAAPLLAAGTANAQTATPQTPPTSGAVGNHRLLGGKLDVSSVGLGVQNMTRTYQTLIPDRSEMLRIIRRAHDEGVTFFDAAEAYGPFVVEELLGEAVEPFRDEVVVATKFGWNIDQDTGARLPGLNSRPQHMRVVVEGMLRRLRTDRIDLLYQHRVDPEVPIEDVAGTIKDLMQEGKVLNWGMSEMGQATLRRAHAETPLAAVQNEYSMLWRGPEDWVLPACEELGIGFVAWSPLGVGFLTGAIDMQSSFAPADARAMEGRFDPENRENNLAVVDLAKDWAARKQVAPGQIALAWLLAQKPWIAVIPGTTQMAHMMQNTGARDVRFTPEELAEFTTALNAIEVRGERLPARVLAFSEVEAPLKQ